MGDEGAAVSSWVEEALLELIDDETPEYRVVKATAREALKLAIEEAARRCQRVADEALALDAADGVHPDSRRGIQQPAYLSAALSCKEAIEAMPVDDPQAKERP